MAKRNKPKKTVRLAQEKLDDFEKKYKEILDL